MARTRTKTQDGDAALEGAQVPAIQQNAPSTAVALAMTYSPPEVLALAIKSAATVDVIERLAALAERWQIAQAERAAAAAFNGAFVDAKSEIPVITKNRHVKFAAKDANKPDIDYWHEDLGEIARVVDPILTKSGLAYRWQLEDIEGGRFKVTCFLFHRDGHSVNAWATAARDTSGSKNDIQGMSSSHTYLKRATLKAVLGLAAGDKDDDGRAAPNEPVPLPADAVTHEQLTLILDLANRTNTTTDAICEWLSIPTINHLNQKQVDQTMVALKKKLKILTEGKPGKSA
jgi:hypothetical protein